MIECPAQAGAAPKAAAWTHSPAHLRCPCCGQTRQLSAADEWPPALLQIVALCPDCSGHGQDSALLMFADGRIVAEHPPAR